MSDATARARCVKLQRELTHVCAQAIEKAMGKRKHSASAGEASPAAATQTPQAAALAKVKRGASPAPPSAKSAASKPRALVKSPGSARSPSPSPARAQKPAPHSATQHQQASSVPTYPRCGPLTRRASRGANSTLQSYSPAVPPAYEPKPRQAAKPVHRSPSPPRQARTTEVGRPVAQPPPPSTRPRRFFLAAFAGILCAFLAFLLSARVNPALATLPPATHQLAIQSTNGLDVAMREEVSRMAQTTGMSDGTIAELVAAYNGNVAQMHRLWIAVGALIGFTAGLLLG